LRRILQQSAATPAVAALVSDRELRNYRSVINRKSGIS
jgi:hypothetical protein